MMQRPQPSVRDQEWPRVAIVVPVFDEATTIGAKIANLAALDYPRDRMSVHIVDGASTDDTLRHIHEASAAWGLAIDVVVIAGGKVPQLNGAFARARGDFVLVTDADARLEPGTLRNMVIAARQRGGALVGSTVTPQSTLALDHGFWRASNALRRIEHRMFGSAGLVVGPCYLIRRDLATLLPESVVADDVFVTFRALAGGHRVELVNERVVELRGPRHGGEFVRHKVRKARAYVREIWRFLPRAVRMTGPGRLVFLGRAALLVALPWGLLASLAAMGLRWPAWGLLAVAASVVTTAVSLLVPDSSRLGRMAAMASLVPVAVVVLATASVSAWWRPHSSRYPKVSLFPEPRSD